MKTVGLGVNLSTCTALPSKFVNCLCVVLLTVLTSCKYAPTTNTVVSKALSPDGRVLALLVDRYYHAARISDGFFLVVIPTAQDINDVINARHIEDSSVLVATWASNVQLHWQSNDTLVVVCASCGIKAIDISKKLDHIGTTRIVYQGFPEHTAYS